MKQVAVIGLGRFGSSVARTLAESGCEVLAVDVDEVRVKAIADEVTDAVRANALEEEALRALGLRNFEVVVVAIGHEVEASILVTVLLKEMGISKIVAKAQDELHGRVLQKVGADMVVFPERDMGVRLAHTLISRNVIDEIQLSTDYSILEMVAPHRFLGRSLKELELRQRFGLTILAIRREDRIIVSPDAEQTLEEGDILVALGQPEKLEGLNE
ncbi:MAG: TrkA-N domain protein [Deltaproteobacteria bacterium]|jgi:trk system potassium uptake protein TrkA|nr:TrkA-N domain protein [Deltaproteobacteria bacterium]MBP1778697.1 TrkA-N domain protein [candidate division NC10 bacterium]